MYLHTKIPKIVSPLHFYIFGTMRAIIKSIVYLLLVQFRLGVNYTKKKKQDRNDNNFSHKIKFQYLDDTSTFLI